MNKSITFFKSFFPESGLGIKVTILAIGALMPFFFIMLYGVENSLSSYWNTPIQPFFIIGNILTVSVLIKTPKWKVSAVLLFCITVFSIEYYHNVHNLFACLFFVANLIPLARSNHFQFCFWLYLLSLPLMLVDILLAEIVCIEILCLYHSLATIELFRLKNRTN